MHWTTVSIVLAVVVAFYVLKRAGQISAKDARKHLKSGALLIDVRTPAEFKSGHLPEAINLPLQQIETTMARHVKDKNQAVLLHCQSGMRSGMARKKLTAIGYTNVFNLGSYSRAARVVSDK